MKNNLAARRKELKMTQAQEAKAISVSESHYQHYEYGLHTPSVYVAIALAKVLQTTVEELFPEEPPAQIYDDEQ